MVVKAVVGIEVCDGLGEGAERVITLLDVLRVYKVSQSCLAMRQETLWHPLTPEVVCPALKGKLYTVCEVVTYFALVLFQLFQ